MTQGQFCLEGQALLQYSLIIFINIIITNMIITIIIIFFFFTSLAAIIANIYQVPLSATYHARHLTFNLLKNLMRQGILLFPFYQCEDWGTKRLRILPRPHARRCRVYFMQVCILLIVTLTSSGLSGQCPYADDRATFSFEVPVLLPYSLACTQVFCFAIFFLLRLCSDNWSSPRTGQPSDWVPSTCSQT